MNTFAISCHTGKTFILSCNNCTPIMGAKESYSTQEEAAKALLDILKREYNFCVYGPNGVWFIPGDKKVMYVVAKDTCDRNHLFKYGKWEKIASVNDDLRGYFYTYLQILEALSLLYGFKLEVKFTEKENPVEKLFNQAKSDIENIRSVKIRHRKHDFYKDKDNIIMGIKLQAFQDYLHLLDNGIVKKEDTKKMLKLNVL
jgi:hypothetical protein